MHNGEVTVHVYAKEEEAAAIHVDMENGSREATEQGTKGPVVVGIVVYSQGQREGEEEVTECQVTKEGSHH